MSLNSIFPRRVRFYGPMLTSYSLTVASLVSVIHNHLAQHSRETGYKFWMYPVYFPVTKTRLWCIHILLGVYPSYFNHPFINYFLQVRYYIIVLVVSDKSSDRVFLGPKPVMATS